MAPVTLPAMFDERAALDSLTAHIAILDENGMILAVNRTWRRFAEANGAAPDSFGAGANYLQVCDGADGECRQEAAEVAQGIRDVLDGRRELFSLEYPCHAPGEERWFLMRVTRLPGEAGARAIVSHENITDRKRTELSLEAQIRELADATETLARRNQELDQFAYITSHDLKAPLRGIANLSRWIEEDLGDALTDDVREHTRLLRGRVNRMEAMINGILEYSRIGRARELLEPVDVARLLEDITDLLAPPPGFVIEIGAGMPTLAAEKVRLQQVFQNLLSNALKHHGGSAGHIAVTARDQGGFYEFAVADDGPGIPAPYQERVWTIFQTLEARDKVENTGVGLALVKKIVEDQGGTVSLESAAGQGATFRFTWPKMSKSK